MMITRVDNVNPAILRQCREQLGLVLDDVKKNVPKIAEIEAGEVKPTYKQLLTLGEMCRVPDWVFLLEEIPPEYRYDTMPAFRVFSDKMDDFALRHMDDFDFKRQVMRMRILMVVVQQLRELILDLRETQEPIGKFTGPSYQGQSATEMAQLARAWLGAGDKSFKFEEWREQIEAKNVFVFMTGKFPGWSKADPKIFRGFSIYNAQLPIVVINDSDSYKAQSFTLFHELGHILRKETDIDPNDIFESPNENVAAEIWCNQFAAELLMPQASFRRVWNSQSVQSLNDVKRIADQFNVSNYAVIVRARRLKYLGQTEFDELKRQLPQRNNSTEPRRISRIRPSEVVRQYGSIFSRTVVQSYHDREIGLHRMCQMFELKNPSHGMKVLELVK